MRNEERIRMRRLLRTDPLTGGLFHVTFEHHLEPGLFGARARYDRVARVARK